MTPRGRPGPDSTLDDVRSKLVSAGTKLLRERGAELGLATVSLSDAITEADVARSTAYRSLAHDDLAPQAVLHQEILTQILTRFGRGTTVGAIQQSVSQELDRYAEAIQSGSVAQRTTALRAVIRVGANTSYSNVVDSAERAVLMAVYGFLRSSPAPPDWRHEALMEGERNLNDVFTELYCAMAEMFDYQVIPPLTMNQFAAAGASLVEGIAMRHGFNREVTMIQRPTGTNGAAEAWSLFAVAFEALFIGMCTPKNSENPFADLRRY